jgi:putative hemolysin
MLWAEDSVETWEDTIHRTRHSRFPICGESVDNIIGILNAKDYFRLEDKSRENIMKNAVREPYFVHETMKADVLFAQMKKRGAHHFAVVVDEYGGMTGIITLNDLVEQLVGDLGDGEFTEEQPLVEQVEEFAWKVNGSIPLEEISETIGVALFSDEYDTLNGMIFHTLGTIPEVGEEITLIDGKVFVKIVHIENRQVESAIIRVSK